MLVKQSRDREHVAVDISHVLVGLVVAQLVEGVAREALAHSAPREVKTPENEQNVNQLSLTMMSVSLASTLFLASSPCMVEAGCLTRPRHTFCICRVSSVE